MKTLAEVRAARAELASDALNDMARAINGIIRSYSYKSNWGLARAIATEIVRQELADS